MKDINTATNELIKQGYNKTLIKQLLAHQGYTNEQIKSVDADIPSKKSAEVDATAVMQAIIDMGDAPRKDIAKHLAEQKLCSEKTAAHILSLMKFCRAYHELMS